MTYSKMSMGPNNLLVTDPQESRWLSLLQAVDRCRRAGLTEDRAQRAICDALKQKLVRYRWESNALRGGTDAEFAVNGYSPQVHVPSTLQPDQLSWEMSQPTVLWPVTVAGSWPSLFLVITRLELLAEDVCAIATKEMHSPPRESSFDGRAPLLRQPMQSGIATRGQVIEAMHDHYDDCERRSLKPPNVNEIRKPTVELLASRGLTAKYETIDEIARLPEMKARRMRRGARFDRIKKQGT